METMKCLWCSRVVPITKKGLLAQHHNLPRFKLCLGCGFRPRIAKTEKKRKRKVLMEA
jgi:hypothetical protein